MRYDWPDFNGEIPVAFLNCQRQAELLRKALGLFDDRLLQFLFRQGVHFALCSERHTPSRTLARWYPYDNDMWARDYFGTSYDEAWGWYDHHTATVIVTKRQAVLTLVHEIGHAVDYLLGDLSPAYFRPGHGVSAYADVDGREFWAEAFEQWFCPWGDRRRVAQAHPEFPYLFSRLHQMVAG